MNNPPPPKRGKGGRPKKDITNPRTLAILEDKKEAWRLRSEERLTYRQIAQKLNLSLPVVFDYVNEKPNAIKRLTNEYRQNYIEQQLEEIEDMIRLARGQLNSLPTSNNPQLEMRDAIASARARADLIRTISQLLERQSKLLGLDEPTKFESQTKDILFVMDLGATPNDTTND